MKLPLNRFGGRLGIALSVVGFFLIFLGWNGSGSYDDVPAQFPYLISGGVGGLALVVLGAAFVLVDNQRRDRAELQADLRQLRDAVERLAAATASTGARNGRATAADGLVVAGSTTYHRTTCRLVQGRDDLPRVTISEAQARGLRGCRTCDAGELAGVG